MKSIAARYGGRPPSASGSRAPDADCLPSSDGLSRLLFLERHGHRRVRREANPLPFDVGDQPEVDEMRVALVLPLAAVALREPDAPVGDTVDGADMDSVRANHFHVLGNLVRGHLVSPLVSPIALEQRSE